MPLFLRRCVARDGEAGFLRRELIRVHEELVPRATGLQEVTVYREQSIGCEFLSLSLYDDEAALHRDEHEALMDALRAIETAHAGEPTTELRLETILEYASLPQPSLHSAAVLLRARLGRAPDLRARLRPTIEAITERMKPRRAVVAYAVEQPELFVIVGDSEQPFDVDRYLTSGFGRRTTGSLEPYLAAAPRYFLLDPVWRYFRRLRG